MDNYAPLPLLRGGQKIAAFRANQEGVPVVLQHGLGADPLQTVNVVPLNGTHCHYLMHCRGHGASEAGPVDQFSITTFADDLIAFIDQHIQAPCVVGGISMGAAISLRVAIKRPDLVSALILARPAWFTDPAPENLKPLVDVGNLLATHDIAEAKKLFLASPSASILQQSAPGNLTSLLNMFDRAPQAVTAELLRRIANGGPDVTVAEIANIKVPTLIIANDQDYVHPVLLADELAATIPGAIRVDITPKTVDEAAYASDFSGALAQFLKDHS